MNSILITQYNKLTHVTRMLLLLFETQESGYVHCSLDSDSCNVLDHSKVVWILEDGGAMSKETVQENSLYHRVCVFFSPLTLCSAKVLSRESALDSTNNTVQQVYICNMHAVPVV